MIEARAREALRDLLGEAVAFDVPLARHTSLGVGGPAAALAAPREAATAATCLSCCATFAIPVLPVGGGFNLLVRDEGWPGLVLRTHKLRRLEREGDELIAGAGVSHSQLTRRAVEAGLGGIEFAAGIPGSVGGWIAMNAGIPEREIAAVTHAVEVVRPTGEREWRGAAALRFGYRNAAGLEAGALVTAARFRLHPEEPGRLREGVASHLAHRRLTQPVDQPSCGSVFKNPPEDHAGRLIEASGLKGTRVGGAEISTQHANFIVTRAPVRAADVLALIETAQEAVLARFGVLLEPEVRIVGSRP